MASGSISLWQIEAVKVEARSGFIFLVSKITADSGCSHEIKRCLLLGRKATTNLKVKVKSLSRVRLFATPWTVAHQAPPSMEFSRQEYWSGLPFPSPGDFPGPEIEPGLLYCRQTLYHLSHQGSPCLVFYTKFFPLFLLW